MIVVNELEYARSCLDRINARKFYDCAMRKSLPKEVVLDLIYVARYYRYTEILNKDKVIERLIEYCKTLCGNFRLIDRQRFHSICEKVYDKYARKPLTDYNGVWITENELRVIDSVDRLGKPYKRLLFSLLCVSKLNSIRFGNGGWINVDVKEIFEAARVTCSKQGRIEYLSTLKYNGLIDIPDFDGRYVENFKVNFIDSDENSEKVLFINDFRELGYEYENYRFGGYIRCAECNRLTKNNKYKNKKYCSECSVPIPKNKKIILCQNCGKPVIVGSKNNKTKYCKNCL